MTLWRTLLAWLAALSADPAAIDADPPRAYAAYRTAYAALAPGDDQPQPDPPAPTPPPAPRPTREPIACRCGGPCSPKCACGCQCPDGRCGTTSPPPKRAQ